MRSLWVVVLLSLAGPVFAQAPAAPAPADPLVGSASLGYLATSGNTDSTNANGSFKVTWDLDGPWKHDWTALLISARTNGVTTAESYSAGYKAQRDFSETSYLFFSGDWRQDLFSGFDRQVSRPSARP
jgi:putative salt-induced outer membrane protein